MKSMDFKQLKQFDAFRPFPNAVAVLALLVVLVLAIFYIRNYAKIIALGQQPHTVATDAEHQLPPILKRHEKADIVDDYVYKYYYAWMPDFHLAFYSLSTRLGLGVEAVSEPIALFQLFVTLLFLAWASWNIGDARTALFTIGLVLGSYIFRDITGNIPRSHAFPTLAVGLWALTARRPLIVGLGTIFAAGTYPPAAVLLGTSLFLWTAHDWIVSSEKQEPSRNYLLIVLGMAGILTVAVLGQKMYRFHTTMGSRVSIKQADEFPEVGPNGTSYTRTVLETVSVKKQLVEQVFNRLFLTGVPWNSRLHQWAQRLSIVFKLALFLLLAAGTVLLYRHHDQTGKPLVFFIVGSLLIYVLAKLFDPYLYFSTRYLYYGTSISLTVLIPYATFWVSDAISERIRPGNQSWKLALAMVLALGILLPYSSRGPHPDGRYRNLDDEQFKVCQFVETLPKSSYLAIWPRGGLALCLPMLAKQKVFLNKSIHLPLSRDYLLEMRRRANLFFQAYYSTQPTPWQQLHQHDHITHVIVDKRHFSGEMPQYPAPFDKLLLSLKQKLGDQTPWILGPGQKGLIFETDHFQVIDLSKALNESKNGIS